MQGGTMYDTYFALLERPELRQFGLIGRRIAHRTPRFSPLVYSRSAGIEFSEENEAYAHWIAEGRRQGLEWSKNKNTLLKIVLKAKDETDLIDTWISHHASLVGYENLIIVDCGSQDPKYLAKLRLYEPLVIILSYKQRYDYLHSTESNSAFYRFLSDNCKYVVVLDADEFLFGRDRDTVSGDRLIEVLQQEGLPFFGGIWINAIIATNKAKDAAARASYVLDITPSSIKAGAVAGKAIVRTDIVQEIGHVGHNLHVHKVFSHVSPHSFGQVFVLHLKDPRSVPKRALSHLLGKGHVAPDTSEGIERQVSALLNDSNTPEPVRRYAMLFRTGEAFCFDEYIPVDDIISSPKLSLLPQLSLALANVDFSALIEERRLATSFGEGR